MGPDETLTTHQTCVDAVKSNVSQHELTSDDPDIKKHLVQRSSLYGLFVVFDRLAFT